MSASTFAMKLVWTVSLHFYQDATLKVWDCDSGELIRTLKGHTNTVQSVDFDHTGKYLGTEYR